LIGREAAGNFVAAILNLCRLRDAVAVRSAGFDHASSGKEIYANGLGLCCFDFLSGFEAILIGLNRCGVCVICFIRDQLNFCLAHHDLGRVHGTYGAHISLLEFLQDYSQPFMFY